MSPVNRQRPAFQGQKASSTSSTTSTGAAYRRAASAAPTSTGRRCSQSRTRTPQRRTSVTRWSSGSSTGREWAVTVEVRSVSNRKRHSAAYAAESSASRSRTTTVPFAPAASHSGLTA